MKTPPPKENAKPRKKSRLPAILGILFFAVAAGLFLLIKLVDLDSLREPITSALSRASGLDIKIESLNFGFDGSLKLRCNNIQVLTPIGSRELFSAETLLLDAEIIPLLKKQVRVNHASIIRPVVQLYLGPEEKEAPQPVEEPAQPKTPDAATAPSASTETAESKLLIKIKKVLDEADLNLPHIEVQDGRIELRIKNSDKMLPVSVSTRLEILRRGPRQVDINAKTIDIAIEKIHLSGNAEARNLLENSAVVTLDIKADPLALADLQALGDFFAVAESIRNLGTGTLDKAVMRISTPFQSVFSAETLKQSAHADIAFSMKDWQVRGLAVPSIEGEAAWQENKLNHKIRGNAMEGSFTAQGTLTPGTGANPSASVNSEITWVGVNLAQVKLDPSLPWAPVTGKTSGVMEVRGTLDGEDPWSRLHIKTSLQGENIDLSVPENLQPLKVTLGGVSIEATLQNNKLEHQARADLFNGTLEESGTLILPSSQGSAPRINAGIQFRDIDTAQLGFLKNISWAPTGGQLSGTVNLNGDLPQEGGSVPDPLQIRTSLQGKDFSLNVPPDMKPLEVALSKVSVEGTLHRKRFTHKIKASLFDGEINESGVISLPEKENTDINADIQWQKINLGNIQTPLQGEWIPSGGTTSGTLNIQGALGGAKDSVLKNLHFKGKLGAEKLSLGTPEPRHGAAKLFLVLTEKSKNLTTGQLQIDGGQIQNFLFKKIQSVFQIEPDVIRITQARILPQRGLLKLKGGFRPASKTYELEFAGEELHIEDFWAEALEGPGKLSGKLNGNLLALDKAREQGEATSYKHLLRGMNGIVHLDLADGKIRISKSFEAILTLLNPASVVTAQKQGLNYKHLGGDILIREGVAKTDNFDLEGPQMNVFAHAQADFHSNALNGEIKVMPLQLLDNIVKAVPLLGKILTGGKKGGVIETYFDLGGTLENPEVSLSASKSFFKKPGRIANEIIDLPGSLLGSGKKE